VPCSIRDWRALSAHHVLNNLNHQYTQRAGKGLLRFGDIVSSEWVGVLAAGKSGVVWVEG
jgi:hypothetical protein